MAKPIETNTAVPVVPARNDLEPRDPFVKSTIADQAGHRPGYIRKWFAVDPKHPSYFRNKLRPYHVGNPDIGYATVQPWSVVESVDAKPGRKREDDTSGIETALVHGDLVCLETPIENQALELEAERRTEKLRNERLHAGERSEYESGQAELRQAVGTDRSIRTPNQMFGR